MPNGELLLHYTEAAVGRADDLEAVRNTVLSELGEPATIDAAATIANFQRMVRIADGCGIPLDEFTRQSSEPWRESLGLHSYASAGNTFG